MFKIFEVLDRHDSPPVHFLIIPRNCLMEILKDGRFQQCIAAGICGTSKAVRGIDSPRP